MKKQSKRGNDNITNEGLMDGPLQMNSLVTDEGRHRAGDDTGLHQAYYNSNVYIDTVIHQHIIDWNEQLPQSVGDWIEFASQVILR